jgi:ribonuclease HIII
MKIYISIDGVLRNFMNRFHYHYENSYINVEQNEESDLFEYKVIEPITNNNLSDHFLFQSKDQQDFFQFIEYPMELYGHSPVSYNNVNNDLNKMVYENSEHEFYLIGVDELGKSRPATFFFLSRNGIMVNNVKFIKANEIEKEWENADVWISDSKQIMDLKPENKEFILFSTMYNEYFTHDKKIDKLSYINFINNSTIINSETQKLLDA